MRFDRFTERAQDAAARAYEIVQRYGHTQVDTEHLFLALLEQQDGAVPQILEQLNVSPADITDRIDPLAGITVDASYKAAASWLSHSLNGNVITFSADRAAMADGATLRS